VQSWQTYPFLLVMILAEPGGRGELLWEFVVLGAFPFTGKTDVLDLGLYL
jgi:hypothetical protein